MLADKWEPRIWDLIQKSGIPLELEVYRKIVARPNWDAIPSEMYIDPDEGKERELDLHAVREEGSIHNRVNIVLHLVIQCKKVPGNAWVFFPIEGLMGFVPTLGTVELASIRRPRDIVRDFDMLGLNSGDPIASRHYLELALDDDRTNRRGKNPENLFEAKVTVTKATLYLRGNREKI